MGSGLVYLPCVFQNAQHIFVDLEIEGLEPCHRLGYAGMSAMLTTASVSVLTVSNSEGLPKPPEVALILTSHHLLPPRQRVLQVPRSSVQHIVVPVRAARLRTLLDALDDRLALLVRADDVGDKTYDSHDLGI